MEVFNQDKRRSYLQPTSGISSELQENSREALFYSGEQIHQFFTKWEGVKSSQDLSDSDSMCSSERTEKGIAFNPIHVFEDVEGDHSSLNWGDCVFIESRVVDGLDCGCSPVYEGSVDSLNFDNLLSSPNLTRTSLYSNMCFDSEKPVCGLPRNPECSQILSHLLTSDERVMCIDQRMDSDKLPKDADDSLATSVEPMLQDHIPEISGIYDGVPCGGRLDLELRDSLLEERIVSHSHTDQIKTQNYLCTDKYQPQNAKQICGNGDPVKSLNEWLRLWHKRCSQTSTSCIDEDYSVVQDIGLDNQQSDSDTNSGGENLKNVLLVTGPVGSGKSAAIYACARDQGFQIVEVNASDWRDGALVEKMFGDAVKCHRVQGNEENATKSDNKPVSKILKAFNEAQRLDYELIKELQSIGQSDFPDVWSWPTLLLSPGSNKPAKSWSVIKTLLLFEDVDATIHQDRGLITAIQQLSKRAKRPMILTRNSDNLVLPKNLDRLELSFSLPTMQELHGLVTMICGAEKSNIHPCLIERFVNYCQGDIRKTIMLLQFWCRGQTPRRGNEMHVTHWPMLFDIDAGHRILPRVINWGYPSHLSDFVADEINESLTIDLVKETWKKLHDKRIDLNKYVTAEERTISRGLLFGYRMCDLISETDMLLKDCHEDSLGSNPHSYTYSDNQLEMCSILGQHGICLYFKEIASVEGSTNISDLASEMVLSSSSSVALGKLASQDQTKLDISNEKNPDPLTSKSNSCLSRILKGVVPSRSYLSAKGAAFHEYTSTLTQISRYEDSRLSECTQRKRKGAHHYLSSGMSSEEISLLRQYTKTRL